MEHWISILPREPTPAFSSNSAESADINKLPPCGICPFGRHFSRERTPSSEETITKPLSWNKNKIFKSSQEIQKVNVFLIITEHMNFILAVFSSTLLWNHVIHVSKLQVHFFPIMTLIFYDNFGLKIYISRMFVSLMYYCILISGSPNGSSWHR